MTLHFKLFRLWTQGFFNPIIPLNSLNPLQPPSNLLTHDTAYQACFPLKSELGRHLLTLFSPFVSFIYQKSLGWKPHANMTSNRGPWGLSHPYPPQTPEVTVNQSMYKESWRLWSDKEMSIILCWPTATDKRGRDRMRGVRAVSDGICAEGHNETFF